MRTTTEYGKMKEQRPRIKKARKEPPARERKSGNPPQITVPWGRGASNYRPGLFTRQYFEKHGEACAADVFYQLRRDLERINRERIEIGEQPLKGCTYSSFAKYWHWFKLLHLIEPTDRREHAIYDFLKERQFYRLTDKGRAEKEAWQDPLRAAHPEFG